jgi:hypothetical protein
MGAAEYLLATQRADEQSRCLATLSHTLGHYATVPQCRAISEGLVVTVSEDATLVGWCPQTGHKLFQASFIGGVPCTVIDADLDSSGVHRIYVETMGSVILDSFIPNP